MIDAEEERGPLQPDPFGDPTKVTIPPPLFWTNDRPHPPLSTHRSSVAVAAFIPKGALPLLPHGLMFRDDGLVEQPQWLSEVVKQDAYRVLHGIQLEWGSIGTKRWLWPTDVRCLRKANRTSLKLLNIKFEAPMQIAPNPPWMPQPPPPHVTPVEMGGVGESLRAKNGFFESTLGRAVGPAGVKVMKLFGSSTSDEVPQIGSSLQLWVAADGCRAVVAVHNHFPRYVYYLDGWRVDWANETSPNFRTFDGYQIGVEWRPLIVTAMYQAMRSYTPKQRYPGGCTYGWWHHVDTSGTLQWCGANTPLTRIDFGHPPASTDAWWRALTEYVEAAAKERPEDLEEGVAKVLDERWEQLGARRWRCTQFRPRG